MLMLRVAVIILLLTCQEISCGNPIQHIANFMTLIKQMQKGTFSVLEMTPYMNGFKFPESWKKTYFNNEPTPGIYMIGVTHGGVEITDILKEIDDWGVKKKSISQLNFIPLYFGQSKNLPQRLMHHANINRENDFAGKFSLETLTLNDQVLHDLKFYVMFTEMPDSFSAKYIEHKVLKTYEFPFNKALQRDKKLKFKLVDDPNKKLYLDEQLYPDAKNEYLKKVTEAMAVMSMKEEIQKVTIQNLEDTIKDLL